MEDKSYETSVAVVAEAVSETRGEPLIPTIVRVVGEVESRLPDELPPLYTAIDPDGLLAVCGEWAEKTRDGSRAVTFEYSDSTVLVERGAITVSPKVR